MLERPGVGWGGETGFSWGGIKCATLGIRSAGLPSPPSHTLVSATSHFLLCLGGVFQEGTSAGFQKGKNRRVSHGQWDFHAPRQRLSRIRLQRQRRTRPPRPPRPPARGPLTSSAWPSSRSKVTTHTHSSQAEKRAQGVPGARVPEDGAPRRPRARCCPAPAPWSITAATGTAQRCSGNGRRRCRGNRPAAAARARQHRAAEQSSGRRGPERPRRDLARPWRLEERRAAERLRDHQRDAPARARAARPPPGGETSGGRSDRRGRAWAGSRPRGPWCVPAWSSRASVLPGRVSSLPSSRSAGCPGLPRVLSPWSPPGVRFCRGSVCDL